MVFDGPIGCFVLRTIDSVSRKMSFLSSKVSYVSRCGLTVLVVLTLVAAAGADAADKTFRLTPSRLTGTARRVHAVVEATGELKVESAGMRVTRLPLKARGENIYLAKVVKVATGTRRDVRLYEKAEATYEVGAARQSTLLADDRRFIVVSVDPSSATLFCPAGPLSRDELELLEIQGNSALLPRLLPDHEVRVGDHWKHAGETVGPLLGLDAIQRNNLQSTLRSVEQEIAIVDFSGSIRGESEGVLSDIEVTGKYNFDLRQRRLTWFTMLVKEDRAIGRAAPGFEMTARVRVTIDPCDTPRELTDSKVAQWPAEASDAVLALQFSSQLSGVRFLHNRAWRAVIDRREVTVLRLLERGDLIAQCNISRLPDVALERRLSLTAFKNEVQRALGARFGEFVAASETPAAAEPRILRVAATGVASGLPIYWAYYHISDAQGRQASLVFTMDGKLTEQFGVADDLIVTSFELADRPENPVKPAPAAETAAVPIDKPSASR